MPGEREDGSARNGYYKITKKGYDFIRGARVPSHTFIYNGNQRGFTESTITINQALKSSFSYDELMAMGAEDLGDI
jgi:hypothetical protein